MPTEPRSRELERAGAWSLLTLGLCVGVVLLAPVLGAATLKLVMFTPLVAVLLMLLLTGEGRRRAGWLGLGLHRAGVQGWGLALLVPTLVLGFAYGCVWLSGVARVVVPDGVEAPGPFVLDVLVSILVVTLLGGIGEEIGWRGYLLPRLLSLGVRRAVLLSGLLHGLFHLPALLGTSLYHAQGNRAVVVPLFLATLTAAGVCYGYLRLTTGSVWPAALAHATFNIAWERLDAFTGTGSPLLLEYLAGESGVLTLGALTVVALWLGRRLPRVEGQRNDRLLRAS
jgi:membrane protease YdiL (CAAX protease family)